MMVKVMVDLSGAFGRAEIEKQTANRCYPRSDKTPRLTQKTFDALHRKGLIEAKKKRLPKKRWSEMFYYQLSIKGEALAMEIVFGSLPVDSTGRRTE